MTLEYFLEQKKACRQARDWSQDKNLKEIWGTCHYHTWLIWLLKKLDFQPITFQELAISSAESVTHLMQDERSKHAVKELRRWLNGESVNLMEVRLAADAADAAAEGLPDDATYAAGYAARSAARAASVIADSYYKAADYAGDTAYAVADATCADNIDIAAADLIRKYIPFEQVAQAAQNQGIEI